jgi:hypothetical protein
MATLTGLVLRLLSFFVAIAAAMNCNFNVCPADPNCGDGSTYCDPATEACKEGGGGLLGECDQIVWEIWVEWPPITTETYIISTYTETTATYTDVYTFYEDSEFSVTDTITVTEVSVVEVDVSSFQGI